MHTTPRLIINCGNFITIDNNVPDILHNFSWFDDNLVHGFSHFLISGIKPMLVRCVFHFKKFKQMFHALKISQGSSKFQKLENGNELDEFVLPVYNNSSNTY